MPTSRRVLVIEDDPPIRQLLCAIALRAGFHPGFACDGESALRQLAADDYDVVLLDLMLPRLNGFEVLRHVSCIFPHLLGRVIVVTATSEDTYRDCRYVSSVWGVIRKPVELDVLEDQLNACWTARALRAS